MIITKELLIQHKACNEAIDFCTRNNIFNHEFDLDNRVGDYKEYISWLEFSLNTIRKYDHAGNVIYKRTPKGRETQYRYNEKRQLITLLPHNKQACEYTYDEAGNRITERSKDRLITYTYNQDNQLIYKDINGAKTEYEYDLKGNVVKETTPNNILQMEYKNEHNKISYFTDNVHVQTRYYYDSKGNLINKLYEDGIEYTWQYDNKGNVVSKSDNNEYISKFTYTHTEDHFIITINGKILLKVRKI